MGQVYYLLKIRSYTITDTESVYATRTEFHINKTNFNF